MSARITSLESFYTQHIEPRRNATTFNQRVKVIFSFKNDGLFKIMMIVGAILAIIGTIGCMVNGLHYMGWANSFERIHLIGVITFVGGLLFGYVHQKHMLHQVYPLISASLGKNS